MKITVAVETTYTIRLTQEEAELLAKFLEKGLDTTNCTFLAEELVVAQEILGELP